METEQVIIPYVPLSYQRMLHDDKHRFKVIVAGRRVGKTTYSINQLIKWSIERNLAVPYWYLAPYTYQAKEIAWHMLLKYVPQILWAKKPTETDLTVYLVNGAKISLKGSDNPWGLEGTALGALIVDEVAAIPHFKSLWEYTLRPMLTDYSSPAIFISKPRGFNHFHELAKLGDHQNILEGELPEGTCMDDNYLTVRLETENNCKQHHGGYILHEEIEDARKQLSPEAFDQEYRAKFVNYSGLVHKLFSREMHILANFAVPLEWRRIRGFDFGSTHPTASIRIAIDSDENWFIESCYKQSNKTIDDHASYLIQEDSDVGGPIAGYGDPSGKQWITEFNIRGLDVRPAQRQENTTEKNWLQLGIDLINSKLQTRDGHIVILPDGYKIENAPSLFILNRPQNIMLVEELETLAYKEQKGINVAVIDDTRDKHGHYDLHASLRYAIVSQSNKITFMIVDPAADKIKQQANIANDLKDEEKRKQYEHAADIELIKRAERESQW